MSTNVPQPPPPAPAAATRFDDKARIAEAMKRSGQDLLSLVLPPIASEQQERHRIYILLLMSLVRVFWNGNRRGPTGSYPFRAKQHADGVYGEGKPYLGHNIAAIAVEAGGRVIDFDFNHNEVFRSSVQHGEARLIQRMFNLTGLRSTWEPGATRDIQAPTFEKMFKEVSIYTTLEPCSQCIGIMALAGVKEVVYLQPDDGTMRVANVLYHLRPYSRAVTPITSDLCGVSYGTELSSRYEKFKEQVFGGTPVWIDPRDKTNMDKSPSLASFLCTDYAFKVFQDASDAFDRLDGDSLNHGEYRPDDPQHAASAEVYSNKQVLEEAMGFLGYAIRLGHRGTPH